MREHAEPFSSSESSDVVTKVPLMSVPRATGPAMRILAVTNMYPTARDPTFGVFVEQQISGLQQIGSVVEVLLVDRVQKGMTAYFRMGREIRTAIASFRPDVVHCMYGGVMAQLVTRAVQRTPTVISFCGDDLLGELLSGPARKLVSRCGIVASYKAARRAQGIVVKSRNLQDALPGDVPASRIRIIPNGVDLERFKPLDRHESRDRLGWRADRLNVLFPANTGDPRKRPGLARAAVEGAERLGVGVDLHCLRGVPHDRVPIWLNAADAVLLTSLHEGSPNIIKEALACDVPVVSVDVGDVRERIQGIDGCYIARADAGDLAAKLQLVHFGPRRVDGRTHVRDLSLRRVAQRLRQFYDETIQFAAVRNRSVCHQNEAPAS
jgi:glycosyltransferase involved in cell wall biosynthesis